MGKSTEEDGNSFLAKESLKCYRGDDLHAGSWRGKKNVGEHTLLGIKTYYRAIIKQKTDNWIRLVNTWLVIKVIVQSNVGKNSLFNIND